MFSWVEIRWQTRPLYSGIKGLFFTKERIVWSTWDVFCGPPGLLVLASFMCTDTSLERNPEGSKDQLPNSTLGIKSRPFVCLICKEIIGNQATPGHIAGLPERLIFLNPLKLKLVVYTQITSWLLVLDVLWETKVQRNVSLSENWILNVKMWGFLSQTHREILHVIKMALFGTTILIMYWKNVCHV